MSQQINLFNPAFAPRRELLSGAGVIVGCALALLAMVAWYAVAEYRLKLLAQQESRDAAALAALQSEITRLAAQAAGRKPNAQLQDELAFRDALLAGRREVMQTLESGIIGTTEGFSEYLRAFARQSETGLWLTGLRIVGAGKDFVIQGRTLDAELVPGYIRRLSRERSLRGHAFGSLIMQLPPERSEPGKDGKARPRPRYLDFSLSTATGEVAPDLRTDARQGVKP